MNYDSNNIFNKIINNEIEAEIVAESEHSIAFKDKFPDAKVHILVIPKTGYINYMDFVQNASIEQQTDFHQLVLKVVQMHNVGYRKGKIMFNLGENIFVPHVHAHIMLD